jgi:hypothetical protein
VKPDLIKPQSQAVAEGNGTNSNGTKRLDTPLGQAVFHAQIPTCRRASILLIELQIASYEAEFAKTLSNPPKTECQPGVDSSGKDRKSGSGGKIAGRKPENRLIYGSRKSEHC